MIAFRGVRGYGPESLHDVMFYASVARTLAEVMGQLNLQVFAEPHMRSLIVDGIEGGAAPFSKRSLKMIRGGPLKFNLRTRLLRSECKRRLWHSILLRLHPLFLVMMSWRR